MKTIEKNEIYEKPKMVFVTTELFENVADECWAKPSLYCLVDPTDEDGCGNTKYADLVNLPLSSNGNGCNNNTKNALKQYLRDNYGPGQGRQHYLTEDDIATIMNSGGGNEGTPLKESQFIDQVRS